MHGRDLRYCCAWKTWLVWDGRRWRLDDTGEVERRAKETVRAIYAEAAAEPDEKRRKRLAGHATRSEAAYRIRALVQLAQTEPEISIRASDLDQGPWLLNVENGTIDLRTAEIRQHRRHDHLTKLVPAEYELGAECPLWKKFLHRVMDGNTALIEFLQRLSGYILTGSTRDRFLVIAHGNGANGKSTFAETLLGLLGDYGRRTPTETLLARRHGGIPNDLARLKGARFVVAAESDQGRQLAEATIKDLTGGDTVGARFLYSEWFEFRPEFKLWLSTNHKPEIRGTDKAIWDRIRLIPFDVTIPEAEQDRGLREQLEAERPGILAWAVEGCLAWQDRGLAAPEEITAATAGYRSDMDVLGSFLADCCRTAGKERALAADLYEAYGTWCEKNGERPMSQRQFGMNLSERGFLRKRSNGRRYWYGLDLRKGSAGSVG